MGTEAYGGGLAERGRAAPHSRLISVVVPAFNEQESLAHLCARLHAALGSLGGNYEIIIVDDGSSDGTLAVLRQLHRDNERVHYISFSRNFGHQAALVAGLEYSRGDAVISLDADLQHPPELIPRMLSLWQQGYDVVYTTKRNSGSLSPLRRLATHIQYAILRRISGMHLAFGQSDFRLLDARVVRELCRLSERDKFLRGLIDWVGFRQVGIAYDVPPRFAGTAKYNFRSRLRLLVLGIFSFTILPLRLFMALGITVSLLSFGYGLWAVALGLYALFTGYSEAVPPGWASVAAAIGFLAGVQLIGIGLLGEYLGRVYDEAKGRPPYIVQETSPRLARNRSAPSLAEPVAAE